jgi:hypothetical protein
MTHNKREQVEKLLWKAYQPGITPNMEELSEKIVEIFSVPNKCCKLCNAPNDCLNPSCECHSPLPSEKESWEEEFEKYYAYCMGVSGALRLKAIKDFIKSQFVSKEEIRKILNNSGEFAIGHDLRALLGE